MNVTECFNALILCINTHVLHTRTVHTGSVDLNPVVLYHVICVPDYSITMGCPHYFTTQSIGE